MKRRAMQVHRQGRERFRAALAITEKDTKAGTFTGYASVFQVPIDTWPPTVIEPGAFKATLANKLDRERVRILWQHHVDEPIGVPVELAEDKQGLKIVGKISDTALGRDALTLLEDGVVREMSIGFDPVKWTMEADPAEPKDPDKMVRHLNEVKLWEVSLVTFGANREALVSQVHALTDGIARDPLRAWQPTEALTRVRAWAGFTTPGLEGPALESMRRRYARAFLVNTLGQEGEPTFRHLIADVAADGRLALHPTAVLLAGLDLVREQFAGQVFTPEAKRAMRDAVATLTSLLAGAGDDEEDDEEEEEEKPPADDKADDEPDDKKKKPADDTPATKESAGEPEEGHPCGGTGKKRMDAQAALLMLEGEAALLGVG